ncbi:ABC transporter ATP-binding protein [Haloferula sp.]|uniref:ABC transporter ATP-binding protein n=1 Tax=Haloferula sp. TaxID=2497595 RepID=UPI003C76A1B1
MSNTSIKIKDLRVDYGEFVAVNDVSLDVPYGEVFGLVGPNGAGKTSTFKVLATLMEPTYGEVSLAGIDIMENTEDAREILGYMPDLAPVPSDLKLWEFLAFYADTHRLGTRRQRLDRVNECLEIVNLNDKRSAWCKQLSRGQTQRLVLAKTLLHRPKVLILDEPASGLDPLSRREMRHALQNLAREGATVLVSSHILSELAEMCSSMCIMNQGEILGVGTADELRRTLGGTERALTATVLEQADALMEWLNGRHGVGEVRTDGKRVIFGYSGDDPSQAELLREMAAAGLGLKSFKEEEASFEEILVQVAEGNREP